MKSAVHNGVWHLVCTEVHDGLLKWLGVGFELSHIALTYQNHEDADMHVGLALQT